MYLLDRTSKLTCISSLKKYSLWSNCMEYKKMWCERQRNIEPKRNKNLSLPWTPQGEKASGNHQFSCQEKKLQA